MIRLLGTATGTLAFGLGGLYALHLGTSSGRVLHEFELLASGAYYHVLAEPLRVRGGTDTRAAGVGGRLARAGLRATSHEPRAGEYRSSPGSISYRRADDDREVWLELNDGVVAAISVDGSYVDSVDLPAEHLTSFRDSPRERRAPVEYADLPQPLVTAVLAAEDRRFSEHRGVDMRGVLRAMVRNMSRGKVVEGGSTITQQTVKLILNRTRRELPAKVDEALLSLLVERRYSKQQILTVYLNNVYLGHEGPFDVHGVAEGARFFFAKPLSELSEEEMFELAAAIRAPNAASPRRHPERLASYTRAIAKAARDVKAPQPEDGAAQAPELTPIALETATVAADRIDFEQAQMAYYFDVLGREWEDMRKRHRIEPPATLVASVDPVLQLRAAKALVEGLDAAAKRRPKSKEAAAALQGAVVAIDPQTGLLRAVVGGRDYAQAPFNRATNITRQVGSTFKPFVYLAALGNSEDESRYTQSTQLPDTLREYQVGDKTWAPANFDHEWRGWVTARLALEQSINAPTVALGMDVGVARVAALAEELGVQDRIAENPSILLGAVETSPLRLASAYSCFPNGGYTVTPRALIEVRCSDGLLQPERPARRRVVTSAGAYLVTDMLVGALKYGTGASAARLGFQHLAAGKTGTSDQARDTWFVGFTPELVTAVWMGFDDNAPTGLSGASAALPVWVRTMQPWLGAGWDQQFEVPPGITFRNVDPITGGMANSTCPDVEMAAYLEDSEPKAYCSVHSPSFGDRLDRLFGDDEGQPFPAPKRGLFSRLKSLFGT
jgi:penicillin-binding protein 1B